MKKLQIYKDAIDFAFSNYQMTDALAISQAVNAHFVEVKFDNRDYQYWLQCFNQARQQYSALDKQPALSAALDAQAAAKSITPTP